LLGTSSRKLRAATLEAAPGLLFVEKPADVALGEDPLWRRTPRLEAAIREQAAAGRKAFTVHGCEHARPVFHVPPGVAGPTPLAVTDEAGAEARNAYGSDLLRLFFQFFALPRGPVLEPQSRITVDLPLARHRREPRMLVSHRTGKRASTHFRLIRAGKSPAEPSLWEAETGLLRPHQLWVHAREAGLHPLRDEFGEVTREFAALNAGGVRGRRGLAVGAGNAAEKAAFRLVRLVRRAAGPNNSEATVAWEIEWPHGHHQDL
jgi:hypothetical protein